MVAEIGKSVGSGEENCMYDVGTCKSVQLKFLPNKSACSVRG